MRTLSMRGRDGPLDGPAHARFSVQNAFSTRSTSGLWGGKADRRGFGPPAYARALATGEAVHHDHVAEAKLRTATFAQALQDAPSAGQSGMVNVVRFENRPPSAQTAVDVFRDRWACDLRPLLGVDGTGPAAIFTEDGRPALAAKALGRDDYQNLDILEIGPLEAAHTYMLEKMGAKSITCVESSVEAWLKCLVVKEVLGLARSTFHLGDVIGFLKDNRRRFDLVYCSGILYHMADPVELIRQIADTADVCFVWTHIYHPERHPVPFVAEPVERLGIRMDHWTHRYGSKEATHWGGIDPTSSWLTREDLLRAFAASGLSDINLIEDQFDHPNGPAILFTARRPRSSSNEPMLPSV